jgi:hypothetical protein
MSEHYLLTESHLPINLYTYLIIMNSYFILFSPKKVSHLPFTLYKQQAKIRYNGST